MKIEEIEKFCKNNSELISNVFTAIFATGVFLMGVGAVLN